MSIIIPHPVLPMENLYSCRGCERLVGSFQLYEYGGLFLSSHLSLLDSVVLVNPWCTGYGDRTWNLWMDRWSPLVRLSKSKPRMLSIRHVNVAWMTWELSIHSTNPRARLKIGHKSDSLSSWASLSSLYSWVNWEPERFANWTWHGAHRS